MAGGIKGITVKIGGDTTELGKSLTQATKQSTALQKELKGVNTLLKYDPKNVTLLKQKQELLTKSIEETKKKLNDLKEVQAKVDAGEIEMTEEEYRNLQREIALTENKLKGLEEEQKKFGSVGAQTIAAYGKQLEETGRKVESVGKKFMPVSAAVAGLGAVAVKTTADFDSAMSQVSAISGATGNDLQALRDKAREMGAQTKFSASEAGDAMSYMAMAGWKTEDMLGGISGVMNLAAASGSDLATTSDILTDGLTAFGLSAQESGRMADVMAAASSNANTNVELLGESYKYCASTAGAMGYSLEDVTESLGLMANAGVKGSQAGTTLKNAMINMAKPTDTMASVMDKYNLSITNSDGSMKSWNQIVDSLRDNLGGLSEAEQTSAVATLFGKEATAGMLSVINAAPGDVAKLTGAINNSTGAAEEMANTMNDNLAGQLTILKSQLSELAISFGEMLMPAIQSIVTHIQNLVDKLNNMSEGQRQVILTIGLLVAAIGPLLLIIGKTMIFVGQVMSAAPMIVSAIGTIKGGALALSGVLKGALLTGLTVVKGALVKLWAVMVANPVGAIITVIGLLVAAFIYAYKHSEKFRNIVNAAFNAVKSTVTSVVSAVISKVNAMKTGMTNAFNAIKSVASAVFNGLKNIILHPIESAKKGVEDAINGIKRVVKGVFDGIKPKLHLSLPKVSVSGGKAPWGIGGKGTLPSFSVKWNKLGAIFDEPTIFGTRLGFQGVGEAGPEAVAPISTLMGYVKTAVNDSEIIDRLGTVESLLSTYLPSMAGGQKIVLDNGTLIGESIDIIDAGLASRQSLKMRGV